MILTVTMNPCIDKTIYLDELEVGAYNRVKNTRIDVAGKGLNVSTVLNHLGEDTLCMGINFRNNGNLLEQTMNSSGLKHHFVYADCSIRTNIKLFEQNSHIMTEINEAGPTVSSSLIDKLIDEIDARLEHTHILVLSGSIPPGVPADIYRRLIRMAHRKDVKTVLDTAGEPFALGLEEKPFLVKPNSLEFEQTFKKDLKAGKGPLEVARSVIESGVSYLCISMGADGALLLDREHAYRAKALPIEAKGLTGAGDSMVAGMCYALRRHLGSEDMLRYAMACSAGSVRQEGTLLARESDVKELLPQVEIEVID